MYRKNTSGQFVCFQGVDVATGGIKSGVTWTVRRCIDGTFAAGGATITEDGTTGWYKAALSQADTNGNNIGFNFTGTGAVPQTVNIVTTDLNPYDAVRFGMSALPNAAADAAGGLPISDAGGLDLDTKLANTNEITVARMGALTDWINGGRLDLILDIIAADTTTDIPALLATIAAYIDTEVAAILADTNELQVDWADGGRLDLILDARATPAQVNAEVLDVLNTDTFAEPGQESPPATTTLVKKIGYLYKAFRNKIISTDSQISLYNDDGTTIGQKASHSDDGTTYTRNEFTTGP